MDYTIQTIVCGAYQENAYLVCPEGGDTAALIDPGDDLPALRRAVAASGRKLGGILLTHGHFDHMLSARALQMESGAAVYVHPADAKMLADRNLSVYDAQGGAPALSGGARGRGPRRGDRNLRPALFRIAHARPHARRRMLLRRGGGALFSGDTLFCAGFGRFDLPGGSARELRASLTRLFALPDETRVLPGHGCETSHRPPERGRYRL